MKCEHCAVEMDTVGLALGNGWLCPECQHVEYDIASVKMAGNFECLESCGCKNCKAKESEIIK